LHENDPWFLQVLVSAFEALSSPEPTPEETKGGKKPKGAAALARSNANCFRTKMHCPRCGDEWAKSDSGVEKYSCACLYFSLYICIYVCYMYVVTQDRNALSTMRR